MTALRVPWRSACAAAALATAAAAGAAWGAETGPHGAPFCNVLADLRSYVEGMRAHDAARLDAMEDAGTCAFLKPGVRIEMTRTFADFGPGTAHPIGVRVFGNGASTDGFTVREMVDGAAP